MMGRFWGIEYMCLVVILKKSVLDEQTLLTFLPNTKVTCY